MSYASDLQSSLSSINDDLESAIAAVDAQLLTDNPGGPGTTRSGATEGLTYKNRKIRGHVMAALQEVRTAYARATEALDLE